MSYHIVCLYPNTPLPAAESGSGVSCAVPGNPIYGSMDFVEWYKVGLPYSVPFCVRECVGCAAISPDKAKKSAEQSYTTAAAAAVD